MIRHRILPVCLFVLVLSVLSATVFASQEKQLFDTGVDHLKQQRYEAAITVFTELIELNPDNPDAYKNRGVAYMKLSQYDSAIHDFEKTKQMMPDLKGLHSNLGVAWYYKGEYEKAIANYNSEIELSPGSHYAYFNRAICWAELKEYDKSLDDIAQTLTLVPDFYLAHCLKGDLYMELEDIEAARSAYEKAVEVDPEAAYAKAQLEKLGPAPEPRETVETDTPERAEATSLTGKVQEPGEASSPAEQTPEPTETSVPTEQTAEQAVTESTAGAPEEKIEEKMSENKTREPEFEIQTGAYQVRKNALDQLNKLHALGYDARILELTRANNVTWHLVRMGTFVDHDSAARAMAEFVKKTGMEAYVRPWNRF
ncbi:MAG: tetratricopeptide repeat protein [Desulfotignum sp.]|nr:tetratricopeptide repeat protein [Desulfotignum sp.]MCF8136897.1 tetratricopeptide repeat protein [Desulfotignum sp.]